MLGSNEEQNVTLVVCQLQEIAYKLQLVVHLEKRKTDKNVTTKTEGIRESYT